MVTEPQRETTDNAAKAAHEAVDTIANSADQLESRIRQTATGVQQNVRGTADRAQRMSGDLLTEMREYVHERPVVSIMMAFAAGIIFSAFLRR